jgi:transcriptional regulator with XRE-family HTH domain
MIGVMLCNERNRAKLTQEQLGNEVGIEQAYISKIENGNAPPPSVTNTDIDRLFRRLGLITARGHASFLKWWHDNA